MASEMALYSEFPSFLALTHLNKILTATLFSFSLGFSYFTVL